MRSPSLPGLAFGLTVVGAAFGLVALDRFSEQNLPATLGDGLVGILCMGAGIALFRLLDRPPD